MSHSTLFVSLIGFAAAEEGRIAMLLENCSALNARWRVVKQGTPDLWIVDGVNARGLGRGLVQVGDSLRFRPAEMPHPVAFAQPLHESISTSHCFDASSMHALNVLLTQLGRWLVPKLLQQALVGHLVDNGASFTRSNVIEVQHHGHTLALLDFEGDTAVAPDATPSDLHRARWALRSRDQAFTPPGFRVAPTEQVLWQFANRCAPHDLLPSRYCRLPIHLRRVPALPPREFTDTQLRIVRDLAYGPRTLDELGDLTGADARTVRRDVAALYLISAITCDPGRSRAARMRRGACGIEAEKELSLFGARPASVAELTAPACSLRAGHARA